MGTLKAAFKAFSFNKLSDYFIFLMLICGAALFNTFDIATILTSCSTLIDLINSNAFYNSNFDYFVFFLMGAAFIKSAQLGAHI